MHYNVNNDNKHSDDINSQIIDNENAGAALAATEQDKDLMIIASDTQPTVITTSTTELPSDTTQTLSAPTLSADWTYLPGIDDVLPLICSSLSRDDVQNLYTCSKRLRSLIRDNTVPIIKSIKWNEPHMKHMRVAFTFFTDEHRSRQHSCKISGMAVDGKKHGVWTDSRNVRITYCFDKMHSINDQPAFVYANEDKTIQKWFKHHVLHRDNDLPAEVIYQRPPKHTMEFSTPMTVMRTRAYATRLQRRLHPKRYRSQTDLLWSMNMLSEEMEQLYINSVPEETRKVIAEDIEKYSVAKGYSMTYYQNGICHRDGDKPAVIRDHYIEFHKHGKLHRSPMLRQKADASDDTHAHKKPRLAENNSSSESEETASNSNDDICDKVMDNGDDLSTATVVAPAIIFYTDNTIGYHLFVEYGKIQSINDVPAVVYADGTMEWRRERRLHRDHDKPAIIKSDGSQEWYQSGQLHRDNDQPAVVSSYKSAKCLDEPMNWYCDPRTRSGKVSSKKYMIHIQNHEIDLCLGQPSRSNVFNLVSTSKTDVPDPDRDASFKKMWYVRGKLHRDNDLPAVIHAIGTKKWYQDGILHRDHDRPAIEHADGRLEWVCKGIRHRSNGPAIVWPDGSTFYFQNGKLHRNDGQPAFIPSLFFPDSHVVWYENDEQIKKVTCSKYYYNQKCCAQKEKKKATK